MPLTDSLKNSIALQVKVPVLSDKTVCTIPSSSFKLLVRAFIGVSVSSWYIFRSRFNKTIAWKTFTNSNETYKEIGIKYPYNTYEVKNANTPTMSVLFTSNGSSEFAVSKYQCFGLSFFTHQEQ